MELQELNTKLAENRAGEIKALSFIAQMTTPPSEDEEKEEEETPVRNLKKETKK